MSLNRMHMIRQRRSYFSYLEVHAARYLGPDLVLRYPRPRKAIALKRESQGGKFQIVIQNIATKMSFECPLADQ